MKMKQKVKTKKERINWLIIVVMTVFGMSFVSSIILIAAKIFMMGILGEIRPGVLVTVGILIAYCIFLLLAFIQLIRRKKSAVRSGIIAMILSIAFSLWYKMFGLALFYPSAGLINIISLNIKNVGVDVLAALLVILYLKRSKFLKKSLNH